MIRVAIIGTGSISKLHTEALLTFPERCRITALCDSRIQSAEALRQQYHLDCRVFDDYKKMLREMPELDLIHVCTPPFLHAGIAIDCMNAGKHVIVEKPMATCLAECDAMLAAADANHVMLACIAQNRFQNAVFKLKKTADSGLAGRICSAQVNSFWWRGGSYYDLPWRGRWETEGGGPTLNHAVHHIDILNWIEEKLPVEVVALLSNVTHEQSEVEDISLACLRYEDGSVAQITSSLLHHGQEQGIELQCAGAKLTLPWHVNAELSRPDGFPSSAENKELIQKINAYYDTLPDLRYEGHTGEIDNILTSLENNTQPLVTGLDGRRALELITAIYKAGFEGQAVSLPIAETDPYYTFEGIISRAPRFHGRES